MQRHGFTIAMMSLCLIPQPAMASQSGPIGLDHGTDIGDTGHRGSMDHDAGRREYRITAGGANIWGSNDAFHFAWSRASGDLNLRARVHFPEAEGNAHRKAGWMVRQSLAPDSPYVDAVVHADGLISLQFRRVQGGITEEVASPIRSSAPVRLERQGDVYSLELIGDRGRNIPIGSVKLAMTDPVYVGLAACSHEAGRPATAVISAVTSEVLGVVPPKGRVLESRLEVFSIDTGLRRIVHKTRDQLEAPNWSRDGRDLIVNGAGRLHAFPTSEQGGSPRPIDTGRRIRCNNDHGISPDGKWLVISDQTGGPSRIFVLPIEGGEPTQVTALGPSYWHGWSPDGKTLAYCASRRGEYDIYTIPVKAGDQAEETRLTNEPGLDDGPDYSPDGKYLYFNSERSGQMKIWRMEANGDHPLPVTTDEPYADWFPHPSPDGKWLLFLSYDRGVKGHPENHEVALRIMPVSGGKPRVLTRLFGGQGTLNVPSWSPDSLSFAFVSYRLIRP